MQNLALSLPPLSKLPGLTEEIERKPVPYDLSGEAIEFYRLKRLPEGETQIPVERYFAARQQMRFMPRYSTNQNRLLPSQAETRNEIEGTLSDWTPLGPGNVGGRTRALLIHPTDPNLMYAAAVAGGVWKTVNAGASWVPLGDMLPNIAVSSMAIDSKNPSVIYAGTGEGFFNFDAIRGAGIFKTTDGGATWTRLNATATPDFYYVNDIVVSPTDGRRVYAVTRAGVWRSVDGGASWVRTLDPAVTGGCLDLVMRSDQPTDYLFASCGTFSQAKVYRNTDASGAGAWTEVLSDSGMGRTSLALAPSNQNIIYAASANPATNNQPGLHAIFRSTASGDQNTWTAQVRKADATKLNTVLFSWTQDAFFSNCGLGPDRFFNTGWYANSIAVDPIDANRVWVGGVDLFRSDDGGANWGLASHSQSNASVPQYAHRHHHAIVFHPQYDGGGNGNKTMFVAGDGGIYKTDDALAATARGTTAPCDPANSAVRWISLNRDYAATQLYHGSPHPDGTRYVAGASGFGFLRGSDGDGVNGWQQMLGGDGGFVVIDPANPNIIYAATSGSFIRKSVDGGQTFAPAYQGILDPGFVYIAPLVSDPSDSSRLWTGGRSLWLSANGAARWSQASPTLQQGSFTAIAVAPDDSNFVVAGTSAGSIIRNANALSGDGQWASATPRAGYVSWLAFDPVDHNVVYAAYSTFGGVHMWRSVDGGATWTGIDGSGAGALPDVPVHSIVVDPQNRSRLFIGTDVRVFVTTDGGVTWAVESGMPNVVTEALALNAGANATQLFAFTYGRGAWRTSLGANDCRYSLSPASVNIKSEGGAGSVAISAPDGCSWSASVNTSGEAWIKIANSGAGSGNGTVSFTVESKSGVSARVGTINIAGRSFTVFQSGRVDQSPPVVKITSPSSTGIFKTANPTINLSGTVTDDTEVVSFEWRNERGFSGYTNVVGKSPWSLSRVTLYPGINNITITARDLFGREGHATIGVVLTASQSLIVVAGSGNYTSGGDGGLAIAAGMSPYYIAIDGAGNLFIAEPFNNRVRRVDASTGIVTTVAGGGSASPGDGGLATNVALAMPRSVAIDQSGNLYITEQGGNRVRKVAPNGIITTLAGTGAAGYSGDGGPAVNAQLSGPTITAFDNAGNLYVADADNRRVRKIAADSSVITTVAGNGIRGFGGDGGPAVNAQFGRIFGLALDNENNLYISDYEYHSVRRVAGVNGIITRVAGLPNGEIVPSLDDVPATNSGLREPAGLAIDGAGNLYIAENAYGKVRKVARATGLITTVVGQGSEEARAGLPPTFVRLSTIQSVAFDRVGNLLFADRLRVWKILPFPVIDSAPLGITISTPASSASHTTDRSPLEIGGTVRLKSTVTHLTLVNDRGYSITSGRVSFGDGKWSFFNLPLAVGGNRITVTVYDLWGDSASATITVIYNSLGIGHTLAGNKIAGFGGDGGPGFAAQLFNPESVALDPSGNLYIADTGNHRIRKVTPQGLITTFAGNGLIGAPDGVPATESSLNAPRGVAVDSNGSVYIADTGNNRIRKVPPDGVITTIAGTGVEGFRGDGGPAINANLNAPYGIAVDAVGNVYFSDFGNHRVRKINVSTGIITSVIGGGFGFSGDGGPATSAKLNSPRGVAIDAASNLFVADSENRRVRKVSASGVINTVAGNGERGVVYGGQPAINSPMISPMAVAVDLQGNLYITDFGVSKVGTDGIINRIAGDNVVGPFRDEGGPPLTLLLGTPAGVAVDRAGNLYVADNAGHRVVLITKYQGVASVQAASFTGPALASESIVAAFGVNLATTIQAASALPLPTSLGGASVRVRDSAGVERFAPLFYVSPSQINYQIPPGSANGPATVIFSNGQGSLSSGSVVIEPVAPGLFSANANGQGVAAATVLRIKADGSQIYEPVAVFDSGQGKFVARPLDFGVQGDQLFLILFGVGWRGRDSLASVTAWVGGEQVDVLYAGEQGGFVGLDQINLALPRTLAGRGEVDLAIIVGGKAANTLRVAFAGATCGYQITSAGQSLSSSGGAVSINVSTTSECFWRASASADWITPDFSGYFKGSGTFSFRVEANASLLPRAAEIKIAGQTVAITQAGAGDTPLPALTITSPSNTGAFTTSTATVNLRGAAESASGVAVLIWHNDRGGSGYAGGANSWSIENILLQPGVNNLTVTAYDNLGRASSAKFVVAFHPQFLIQTVAGGGHSGPGDGGPATSAELSSPRAVAVDAAGNLYIGVYARVMKVTPVGVIRTFAGTGRDDQGPGADNVPATSSHLGQVSGLTFDRNGNLYLSDSRFGRVRKIDMATGFITTVAGTLTVSNSIGDGGPATQAQLYDPGDLAFDGAGNLYIADTFHNRVRTVEAGTGIIRTVAGTGNQDGPLGDGGPAAAARLPLPEGLAIDRAGNLYISTVGDGRVRKVNLTTGIISTVAGGGTGYPGDDGPATEAQLRLSGIAIDGADNLYIADFSRIRRVSAGIITTIAGKIDPSDGGDNGPAILAGLNTPSDLAFNNMGNIYIADLGNKRIRKLTPNLAQPVTQSGGTSTSLNKR